MYYYVLPVKFLTFSFYSRAQSKLTPYIHRWSLPYLSSKCHNQNCKNILLKSKRKSIKNLFWKITLFESVKIERGKEDRLYHTVSASINRRQSIKKSRFWGGGLLKFFQNLPKKAPKSGLFWQKSGGLFEFLSNFVVVVV